MNFSSFFKITAAVIIIALTATACSKTELTDNNEQQVYDRTEQKILDFKEKLKHADKSSETMSIDSAVWYIEAALNYSYCIIEDINIFESGDYGSDSLDVQAEAQVNVLTFETVSSVYNYFDENFADFNSGKIFLADIEYKNGSVKCKYEYISPSGMSDKSMIPTPNLYPDLDYDWLPGSGGCDVNMGTCDGLYPEKSAATVWSKYITMSKGALYNGYYTDIQYAKQFHNDPETGSEAMDTMLYKEYSETVPCVTSRKMHLYFNRGKTVANMYNPPTGWGVPKVEYLTHYNDYPGWTWSKLKVYKGKINLYNPPSEL